MRTEDDELSPDQIVLDVPADGRSLRLLRLAAADAATDVGLDMDRVDCARLVIDELASVLVGFGSGQQGRMKVRIDRHHGAVDLCGDVAAQVDSVVPDLIVRELLDASVGRGAWSIERRDGTVEFRATVAAAPAW